jgi:hypothetical protein
MGMHGEARYLASHEGVEEARVHGLLTARVLKRQNRRFKGTGGVSQENRSQRFSPAFLDARTGTIFLSRFADGRVAPVHVLDGLPQELVVERAASGRVTAIRESVVAGFIRFGRFYTREQAAASVKQAAADNVCPAA